MKKNFLENLVMKNKVMYFHLLFLFVFSFTLISCRHDDSNVETNIIYEYNDWISNSNVKIKRYAKGIHTHQSAASYGNYAVFITENHTNFFFYNLREKKEIYNLPMQSGSLLDYRGGVLYHCNQSSFGPDKYDETDPFPLLYVSQRAREDLRHFVEVFRIHGLWNDSKQEYTSFSAELIQTIYFPPMTSDNSLGNVNVVIDTLSRQMYTYSRNNNSGQENSGICKISRFDLPDTNTPKVYLQDSDIKSSFYINSYASNMQGGCIQDGILYIGRGSHPAGYIYLYVINLELETEVARIDLMDHQQYWEPEGCFFYNGYVMLSTTGGLWQFIK